MYIIKSAKRSSGSAGSQDQDLVGSLGFWFLLRGFFSVPSDFPPSAKTNTSEFQFDLDIEHLQQSHDPLACEYMQTIPTVVNIK